MHVGDVPCVRNVGRAREHPQLGLTCARCTRTEPGLLRCPLLFCFHRLALHRSCELISGTRFAWFIIGPAAWASRRRVDGTRFLSCVAIGATCPLPAAGRRRSAARSQGNWRFSTAMASAVVCRRTVGGGLPGGDVRNNARRSRWLRPKALPPRAPSNCNCSGVLLKKMWGYWTEFLEGI